MAETVQIYAESRTGALEYVKFVEQVKREVLIPAKMEDKNIEKKRNVPCQDIIIFSETEEVSLS